MAHMPSKSSIIERNAGMERKVASQTAPPTGQPAMVPMQGQPLPQNGAALAAGPDNIPAQITDHQGEPQGPASIKAGEIVFSVESIIGAGNGNYEAGAKKLLGLHDRLQDHGAQLVQKQSIAGAQTPSSPDQVQGPQGLAAPSVAPPNGSNGPPMGLPNQ